MSDFVNGFVNLCMEYCVKVREYRERIYTHTSSLRYGVVYQQKNESQSINSSLIRGLDLHYISNIYWKYINIFSIYSIFYKNFVYQDIVITQDLLQCLFRRKSGNDGASTLLTHSLGTSGWYMYSYRCPQLSKYFLLKHEFSHLYLSYSLPPNIPFKWVSCGSTQVLLWMWVYLWEIFNFFSQLNQ